MFQYEKAWQAVRSRIARAAEASAREPDSVRLLAVSKTFPADAVRCSYSTAWNALQRVAAGASTEQKADLFWRGAARFYDLDVDGETV